ncbi:unnamed protein product [Caenorhabditis nigoni]
MVTCSIHLCTLFEVAKRRPRVLARPHSNLESLGKSLDPGRAQLSPKHLRATVDAIPNKLMDVVRIKSNCIEQL